jgi:hypothetical protein
MGRGVGEAVNELLKELRDGRAGAIGMAAAVEIERLTAERDKLVTALSLAAVSFDEIGGDYPGSSCSMWCEKQAEMCRSAGAKVKP